MQNIGIIGLGLIGGSIAKTLKNKTNKIIAFDLNEEELRQALTDKVIDEYTTDINEKFSNLDTIFICTPVNAVYSSVKKLANFITPNCIITDVGSTKHEIVNSIETDFPNIKFVGAHPMVGSEKSGYSASTDYLFENAYYIITKTKSTNEQDLNNIINIIESLKAMPIVVDVEKHDFVVSVISHIPHIVASALVNLVESSDDEEKTMKRLAAGGFKDITRIASSSPIMWQSICNQNKDEILKALMNFKNILNEFIQDMVENKDSDMLNYFENAKKYRDSFNLVPLVSNYYISVDVKDTPGVIAGIATILSLNNINIKNIGIENSREYIGGILKIVFQNEKDMQKSIELLTKMEYEVFVK